MSYRIAITGVTQHAIDAQIEYLATQFGWGDRLDAWIDGLFTTIAALREWPRRYPVAEEMSSAYGREVRRALYGDYAIFYRIDESSKVVLVVGFRHCSRLR